MIAGPDFPPLSRPFSSADIQPAFLFVPSVTNKTAHVKDVQHHLPFSRSPNGSTGVFLRRQSRINPVSDDFDLLRCHFLGTWRHSTCADLLIEKTGSCRTGRHDGPRFATLNNPIQIAQIQSVLR